MGTVEPLHLHLPHTAYLLKEDSGRVTGHSGKLVIHFSSSPKGQARVCEQFFLFYGGKDLQ